MTEYTTIRILKSDRPRLNKWKAQQQLSANGKSFNDADFVKAKLDEYEQEEAGATP